MRNLLLSFFCVLFLSCTQQEFSNSETAKSSFENPYAVLGTIHNAAMDSIKSSKIGLKSLEEFSDSFVNQHFDANDDDVLMNFCSNLSANAKQIGLKYENCLETRAADELTDSVINTLPDDCKQFASEIFNIVDMRLSDSLLIVKEFSAFNEKIAEAPISYEEKQDMWMISAIAQASCLYNRQEISSRVVNGTSIAKADVSGAIGGVVGWRFWVKAACTGLMFGPGGIVMTMSREVVRGAIGSSGVHIVTGGRF